MVKDRVDFVVYDVKLGDDITRQTLTHIILEEENKGGQNLLSTGSLPHLVSVYGDSLQSVIPNYLEHTMKSFTQNQDQIREYMGKEYMETFENTMNFFLPFTKPWTHNR